MADDQVIVRIGADAAPLDAALDAAQAKSEAAFSAIDAASTESASTVTANATRMSAAHDAEVARLEAVVAAHRRVGVSLEEQAAQAAAAGEAQAAAYLAPTAAQRAAMQASIEASAAYSREADVTMEQVAAEEAATGATLEHAAAEKVLAGSMGSSNAIREETALLDELLGHRYRRMPGTLAALGRYGGVTQMLFTGPGLAALGGVGALGAATFAIYKMQEREDELNRTFLATGSVLGMTRGDFEALPGEMQNGVQTAGQLSEALMAVARSGQYTGPRLRSIAEGVAAMSQLTGEKTGEVVKQFDSLGQEPVRALEKLNGQYHFLTQATLDQITALIHEGKAQEASRLEQDLLARSMKERAAEALRDEGWLLRAAHTVGSTFSWMWAQIANAGAPKTLEQQLADVRAKLEGGVGLDIMPYGPAAVNVNKPTGAERMKLLEQEVTLQGKIAKEKHDAAQAARVQNELERHSAELEKEAAAALHGHTAARAKATDTAKQHAEQLARDAQAVTRLSESYAKAADPMRRYREEQIKVDMAYAEGAISAARYLQVSRQIQAAEAADMAKKVQDQQRKIQEGYIHMMDPARRAFSTAINGMIMGTQSFRRVVDNSIANIAASYLQHGMKMLEDWIAWELTKRTVTEATAAHQIATQTSTAAVGGALQSASAMASITKSAGQAAAGGAASVASIPWVGWAMAPAVAAGLEALVLGFTSMASAEGGEWRVPGSRLYHLHPEEMVLPAGPAQGLRDLIEGGGLGGDVHMHIHGDVLDPEDWFRRNSSAILGVVRRGVRDFHIGS